MKRKKKRIPTRTTNKYFGSIFELYKIINRMSMELILSTANLNQEVAKQNEMTENDKKLRVASDLVRYWFFIIYYNMFSGFYDFINVVRSVCVLSFDLLTFQFCCLFRTVWLRESAHYV